MGNVKLNAQPFLSQPRKQDEKRHGHSLRYANPVDNCTWLMILLPNEQCITGTHISFYYKFHEEQSNLPITEHQKTDRPPLQEGSI